jgi:single-stranded DNA-binding protein
MRGNETLITGNLTKDPELRSTEYGPVASFSVANNRRSQEGVESTTFLHCIANGPLAVNVSKSLRKGDAVIVVGYLTNYPVKDGGTMVGLKAEYIGADMTFATVDIEKNERGSYRKNDYIVSAHADDDDDDDEPVVAPRRRAAAKSSAVVEDDDEAPTQPRSSRRTSQERTSRSSRVTKPKPQDDDDDFDDDIDL